MNRRTLLVAGTALVAGAAGAAIGALASDDAPARPAAGDPVVAVAAPRSVILLIGDGMDDSMITAARNYSVGAAARLALDELPSTGAMTTYGLLPGAGPEYPIAYVSDSAATASGFSTGHKTVDGRISQGPSSAQDVPGEDHETVLEMFARLGRRTGNVTTADITDATPAAAAAHVNARSCQDPSTMDACPSARKSAGGRGSIAEQLVDNEVDVLLGGGRERWDRLLEDGSQTLLDYATSTHGYRTVGTAADLDAVAELSGGTQIVADDTGGRRTATVVTADGVPLTVAYSSAEGGDPQRSSHTGTQIRVAAVGPQADRVTGVIDQTDLFALMTSGLDTDGE